MCGRFTLRTAANIVLDEFSATFLGEITPRYNIAPTQQVLVLRGRDRHFDFLRWGLVPSWSPEPRTKSLLVNARAETIASKPSFRNALKRRRCIVPADGYFEWQQIGKKKQPYWIRRRDERLLAMAGIWETWQGSLETFALITTRANETTARIHDRMPVILSPDDYDLWLDPERQNPMELEFLFEPTAAELQATPVNTYVNSAIHDDPKCIETQSPTND